MYLSTFPLRGSGFCFLLFQDQTQGLAFERKVLPLSYIPRLSLLSFFFEHISCYFNCLVWWAVDNRFNIRPFWTLVWSFFVVFYTFLFGRQVSFKGPLLYFLIFVTTQTIPGRKVLSWLSVSEGSTHRDRKEWRIKAVPLRAGQEQRQVNGRAQLGPSPSLFTALRGLAQGMVPTHPMWLSPFSQSFDSTCMETPREVPRHLLGDSKSSQVDKEE